MKKWQDKYIKEYFVVCAHLCTNVHNYTRIFCIDAVLRQIPKINGMSSKTRLSVIPIQFYGSGMKIQVNSGVRKIETIKNFVTDYLLWSGLNCRDIRCSISILPQERFVRMYNERDAGKYSAVDTDNGIFHTIDVCNFKFKCDFYYYLGHELTHLAQCEACGSAKKWYDLFTKKMDDEANIMATAFQETYTKWTG